MNCSICQDDITKETGSTTLSCEHTFHFRCISTWFVKQFMKDLPETCPCCRSEGNEMDRVEFDDTEIEEEEDPPAPQQEGERVVVYHWTRERGVIVDFPPNYLEDLEERNRQNSYIPTAEQTEQVLNRFRQRKKAREEEAATRIQAFFRKYHTTN